MRGLRRFLGDRGGAAALEFALIGLPFIVLLIGLVEVGRGLHIRTALDAAADRVQRAVLIDPEISSDALTVEVRKTFQAGQRELLNVDDLNDPDLGNYRLFSINYRMDMLLPAPLGGPITIGSTRRIALPR